MIVIHIGFPKAGSTTIQTYLNTNQAALRGLSIDFPTLGLANRANHHTIAHELAGRMERIKPKHGGVPELVAHLRGTPYETTIISSECFTPFSGELVSKLADTFAEIDQRFRIVQVIRPLVEIATSSYAQRIRHGSLTCDFDDFFELLSTRDKFNALDVAGRWACVVGWAAIRVRVLDPAQLVNGDLIDDFLVAADLDPGEPALGNLPRPRRTNGSTGWRALEAIRALFSGQSRLDDSHPLAKRAAEGLHERLPKKRIGAAAEEVATENGWSKDRGLYLTREQAERLNREYETAIARLNERLSVRLDKPVDLEARGFVERDFLPSAGHIRPKELKEFYDAVAERLKLNDGAPHSNSKKEFRELKKRFLEACESDEITAERVEMETRLVAMAAELGVEVTRNNRFRTLVSE
jgi:hypothetical protein